MSDATEIKAISELKGFMEQQRKLAETARKLAGIRDSDVELGQTPKTPILSIGGKVLYRCDPGKREVKGPPVLVTYALVGRYTVLDLEPGRSFLESLMKAGLDVYVIDWGHPNRACQFDDLGDYVDGYLDIFVDAVRDHSDHDQINMIGICQGGVLSLCHAALFPGKIRNLMLMVTPVDFHGDKMEEHKERGFMNVWARNLEADDIDLMVDTLGNLPGEMGGLAFTIMTPLRSLAKYNLTLVEAGQDSSRLMNFLRMEKWLADRPAHPGAAARQWLNDLYRENRLARGEFEVDGRRVDLKNVTMPVLNIYTETDHIIPPPMSRGLGDLIGSEDYTDYVARGGHIGVMVAGGSAREELRETIADWLSER